MARAIEEEVGQPDMAEKVFDPATPAEIDDNPKHQLSQTKSMDAFIDSARNATENEHRMSLWQGIRLVCPPHFTVQRPTSLSS